MDKIELYKFENDSIKIEINLYFNDIGQLIFDGYDIGERVKDCFGDSDYEYYYTIDSSEIQKLNSILNVKNGDRNSLLKELKKKFGHNEAYTDFGNFMSENNIKFKAFCWS
ncbi:MAG: hypothetical protein VB011_06820 [Bacteroidales bacterium]|jgi:hypothetical protein|nr:hypothetical protein [Bacteroidales bacterium]